MTQKLQNVNPCDNHQVPQTVSVTDSFKDEDDANFEFKFFTSTVLQYTNDTTV